MLPLPSRVRASALPPLTLTAVAAVAMVVSGCATTRPDDALRDAAKLSAARGAPSVGWRLDAAPDGPLSTEVQALLARPLDADGAVAIAVVRNPALRVTLERAGVAQADLAQATRIADLTLGGSWLAGGGDRKTSLRVGWNLLDVLVMPLRRRLATAAVEQTKLEIGQAVLDLVAATRTAFARAQASRAIADRWADVETAEKAAADFAQALFDAGNLGELERVQARSAWVERRAERIQAELEAAADREAVGRLLGLTDAVPWTSVPLPPVPSSDPPVEQIEERALGRLDLGAARFAVDTLAGALAAKRRTRYLPIELELGVERERETDGVQVTGPALALRLPLFDTGKASVARLESELRRARWQLEEHVVSARSEARGASAGLAAARAREELARVELVPLRARALELTLASYNMMLVGAPSVLLAKQAELAAERSAVTARRDYWIARAELERALGGAPGVDIHNEKLEAGR